MSQDQWCSPLEIARPLQQFVTRRNNPGGLVGLDPCSNPNSVILAKRTYSAGALQLPWDAEDIYENPPYSNLLRFSIKAIAEVESPYKGKQKELIRLVPVATSTEWWGVCLDAAPLLVFTKRIEFLNEHRQKIAGARFDSVLMVWTRDHGTRTTGVGGFTPRQVEFLEAFAPLVRSAVRGHNWTARRRKAAS